MYRGLLSRMLVAVLLIAVIAKPCLGLLADTANASEISIAVADESAVNKDRDSPCNGICLSARIEESTAVLRSSTAWSGGDDWTRVKIQIVITLPYLSHQVETDFSSRLLPSNVRDRLAVLSRFLL